MIPRVFHTVWVQGELPDEKYQAWFDSWLKFNPTWEHVLWAESDYIDWIENRRIYDTAVNHAQRAEIARNEILTRYGGIYIDADFECLRPFDFLDGVECFTGEETPGQMSAGLVGSTAEHPAMRAVLDDSERSILEQRASGRSQTYGTGPHIFERLWRHRTDVTVFPPWMFYPYLWTQTAPADYGDSYAAHHWMKTWK